MRREGKRKKKIGRPLIISSSLHHFIPSSHHPIISSSIRFAHAAPLSLFS